MLIHVSDETVYQAVDPSRESFYAHICINRDVKYGGTVLTERTAREEAILEINLFLKYFPYSTCIPVVGTIKSVVRR